MISAFFQGIVLGLIISILVGPAFFLLLQTSINHGFRQAMKFETGIILGDAFCIFISYIGVANLFSNQVYQNWLGIIGGLIFIGIGLFPFLRKAKLPEKVEISPSATFRTIVKGFILNISNPSVLAFWVGSVGYAISRFGDDVFLAFIYFSTAVLTLFLIDVLKIHFASKSHGKISPAKFQIFNKLVSAGLVVFGIVLLVKVIWY